jgi:hypothetical protein
MAVVGIVPMAVAFLSVETLPLVATGILLPLIAYYFGLLPFNMVGKAFTGHAPMFMLGVFALGATAVEVGFHKRLASWWSAPLLVSRREFSGMQHRYFKARLPNSRRTDFSPVVTSAVLISGFWLPLFFG